MLRLLKRNRGRVAILALFLLPLVVYRANATAPGDANFFDRLVLMAVAPAERMLSGATDFVSGRWHRYVDLVGAREDNIKMRRRMIELETLAGEAEVHVAENERLRRLIALGARRSELTTLAATVIAVGQSSMARTVRIDRGLVDGVSRGDAVIADEGVVGRVQRAGFSSSEVLLIIDDNVSLEVMLSRSRARGRLVGRGTDEAFALELRGALREHEVKVGDRVVSSGLGGVYPKGLAVGTVTEVEVASGGLERIGRVEAAVDFFRLEHVLVVLPDRESAGSMVTPDGVLPEALRPADVSNGTTAPQGPP